MDSKLAYLLGFVSGLGYVAYKLLSMDESELIVFGERVLDFREQ